MCMCTNEQTCLPQGEVVLALHVGWQSIMAGGGCAAQRGGALVEWCVVRGPNHTKMHQMYDIELQLKVWICITLSQNKTTENTYVYQSFWRWMKEGLTPLLPGSFADLLNRNSWSFCFTSVLATAPVRPKVGNNRIGVTLEAMAH